MKKIFIGTVVIMLIFTMSSCVGPPDRYNTQRGAAIGAGYGALAGQIIGRNTRSTLLGAAVGTVIGSVLGNAVDQDYQSGREAAYNTYSTSYSSRPVTYYGSRYYAPVRYYAPYSNDQQAKCRTITRRTIENGRVISETTEEVCEGDRYSREY